MKVAIVSSFMDGRRTGVGNYTFNLVKGLQKIGKGEDLILVHFAKRPEEAYKKSKEVVVRKLPSKLTEMLSLPSTLHRMPCDVVHFPAFTGSQVRAYSAARVPIVLTVHDLTPILFPEAHPTKSALLWGKAFRSAAQYVAHWICDSETTKMDLMRFLGIDENCITVVPLAADRLFRKLTQSKDASKTLIEKYGVAGKFILYVGTLEPRKNIPNLLRAFAVVKRGNIPHKLVLVGAAGWKYDEIFKVIEDLGIQGDVILPGYVPDEDLVLLYNFADLFVYPSLYEGFGLPPLEAMACGTPVVTSNRSSLPEVVGDAALLVDPSDVEALADAIENVLVDQDLRNKLAKKALDRAQLFSWEKTAQQTWSVYEKVSQRI